MSGDIFHVEVGDPICIPTGIISGSTPVAGKFPRVDLCDKGGTSVTGATGFTDVGNGKYWATLPPLPAGVYSGFVHFFDDALYTLPTTGVTSQFVCVMVKDTASLILDALYCDHVADGTIGQAIAGAGGYAGINSIVDTTSHNVNNNQTLARRRVFANKADAVAAGMQNADGADGECLNIKMQDVTFSPGQANISAEVVETIRWTEG